MRELPKHLLPLALTSLIKLVGLLREGSLHSYVGEYIMHELEKGLSNLQLALPKPYTSQLTFIIILQNSLKLFVAVQDS